MKRDSDQEFLWQSDTSLRLAAGYLFDPMNPEPGDVDLRSFVRGIGWAPRFNGQTTRLITVAEHSLRVAELAVGIARSRHWTPLEQVECYLAGLLHDIEEGLVGDTPTPIKSPACRAMGKGVRRAVLQHLDLLSVWEMNAGTVKRADAAALTYEAIMWQPGAVDSYTMASDVALSRMHGARIRHPVRGIRPHLAWIRGRWDRVWLASFYRACKYHAWLQGQKTSKALARLRM